MISRFWLLGAKGSVESVGERLGKALAVEFHAHESGFRGGAYLRGEGVSVQEAIVQQNFEDEDGVLAEEDFPEFPVLIYVTQSTDVPLLDSLESEGVHILRMEEI